MQEASKIVAARLRQLRKRADLSQEQTADLLHISFKYYQRLEAGAVSGIRLDTLEQISRAYGIRVVNLFTIRCPRLDRIIGLPPPHRKKRRSQ